MLLSTEQQPGPGNLCTYVHTSKRLAKNLKGDTGPVGREAKGTKNKTTEGSYAHPTIFEGGTYYNF